MSKESKPIRPFRVNLRQASELVGTSAHHLRLLVNRGFFTAIRDKGAKQGARIYLLPDELEVYALKGLEELQKFRRKHRRRGDEEGQENRSDLRTDQEGTEG